MELVLLPPAKLQLAALSCVVKGQACSLWRRLTPPPPPARRGGGESRSSAVAAFAYSGRRHRIGAATPSPAHHPGSSYEVMNSIAALLTFQHTVKSDPYPLTHLTVYTLCYRHTLHRRIHAHHRLH